MWYWWVGEEKKSCAGKSQRHSLQNVRTWIQKVIMVGMINVGLAQMKKRKTISCRVTLQIARHGGSPCPKLIDFRWCGSARNACKSGYFRFCFEYRWSSAPRFFPDGDQGGELGDSPSQEKDKHASIKRGHPCCCKLRMHVFESKYCWREGASNPCELPHDLCIVIVIWISVFWIFCIYFQIQVTEKYSTAMCCSNPSWICEIVNGRVFRVGTPTPYMTTIQAHQ